MKDMYLVSYKVNGIKTLDEQINLSFFKKTITLPIDTQEYNVKGIYGMNGSGKSGIVTSVEILRNLLVDEDYLNNAMVQKNLDAIINKKLEELCMEVDFLVDISKKPLLYRYKVVLKKGAGSKYRIDSEELSYRIATSRKDASHRLVKVEKGEITEISDGDTDGFTDLFTRKTLNLLSDATTAALYAWKVGANITKKSSLLNSSIAILYLFGRILHTYMDQSDNHVPYFLETMLTYSSEFDSEDLDLDSYLESESMMNRSQLKVLSAGANVVSKDRYNDFADSVRKLEQFVRIFKPDLLGIEIDRKENNEKYICNLLMLYNSYSIHSEFESTGIKKLIRLFAYIEKMVQGGIVFIDEFDSNLHDVYLCALLDYLMEYGKGQLCFTTHNVGPMDILKKNKKSIDFLSIDHKIYSWAKNGNYSPSRLYKSGMVEGSPFNVDSIDFIGVFDNLDEE